MRFVTDLSKGILGRPDSTEMWSNTIVRISDSVLTNPEAKILCVACGHGTEADVIVRRMQSLGVINEEIQGRVFVLDKYKVFTNRMRKKGYTNVINADFMAWETDMKFDVIVGNPPFQDGSQEGGQNKIYNQFSKKALDLLTDTGVIAFITPTSVLKKSKRFSLIGMPGLKYVDFTANNYFTVGATICSWIVDKNYANNTVFVLSDAGEKQQMSSDPIYDHSVVDSDFASLYNKLKKITPTPESRMFKQNAVDATNGRSKTAAKGFDFPVYRIVNGTEELVQYNKPRPKDHKELKFVVSITKALNETACTTSVTDFDVAHMHYPISSNKQADNIKSFILSDAFIEHSNKWKQLDGYGFNNAIKHLPPFDTSKSWTNEEVKEFLESFVE